MPAIGEQGIEKTPKELKLVRFSLTFTFISLAVLGEGRSILERHFPLGH